MPGEGAAPAREPLTPEEDRFATTIARGDLQTASQLLGRYVAATTLDATDASPDGSLLVRAAWVEQALLDGRLDAAAGALASWELPYAAFGEFLDADRAATLNTLGLLLVDWFRHPLAAGHGSYDTLMDDKLAGVAKATRIGSPNRQTFWDPVYARIKSDRELSRLL